MAKNVDGGETWDFFTEGLKGANIFSLSINRFHPDVIYAGTNGDGALRSVDGGASWNPVAGLGTTVWAGPRRPR